jgi:hypothetical protein
MAACCALCNDSTLYYAPDKAHVPQSPRALNGPAQPTNVGQVCLRCSDMDCGGMIALLLDLPERQWHTSVCQAAEA